MDLAKNLAQWRDRPPEQWIGLVNQFLPPVVVALLVILIAFKAAEFTWRLLDEPAEQDMVPAAAVSISRSGESPAGGLNAESIGRLFGERVADADMVPANDILDAEDTTLNLTLTGTIQKQELPERDSIVIPEAGVAAIASGRGEQKVYRTGDTIDNASGAVLHSVFTDRVILDRGGGRLEQLRYPDADQIASNSRGLNSNLAARAPTLPSNPPTSAAAFAEAIGNAAAVLGQHLTIAPEMEGGQMTGIRLQPRGDSEVFEQLGLEPGDVLTEVNGVRLNDPRNTSQVLQALVEAPQASVMIRRNGNEQAQVIDIGRIQQLAESLQ